jgi:hypothetical protein
MNAQRLWLIGSAIVAVALLVVGWFVGVSPQLTAMSETDQQRAGVDLQNAATEAAVARLAEDFSSLDALETERDLLRRSIPVVHDKSLFVDQVDALATASGTTVTQVSTSAVTTYTPPVTEPPVDPDAEAGDEPAEEGTDATEAAPVEPTGPPVVTDPLITGQNLYAIEVTVAVTGSNVEVLDFVDALQHGERLCLVTQLQFAADEETGEFTATSTGYVYVLVDGEAATDGGAGE